MLTNSRRLRKVCSVYNCFSLKLPLRFFIIIRIIRDNEVHNMKIEVCVGSSCHVKGGQDVLNLLKKSINKNGLEDKVTLAGTTCLGQCKSGGVNMRIDGNVVTGVTEAGFNEFFKSNVLAPLGI